MNKTELIEAMAKEASLSKKDAAAALEAFTDAVAKELKKGEKVTLIGFGTFEVGKRAARTGRKHNFNSFFKHLIIKYLLKQLDSEKINNRVQLINHI